MQAPCAVVAIGVSTRLECLSQVLVLTNKTKNVLVLLVASRPIAPASAARSKLQCPRLGVAGCLCACTLYMTMSLYGNAHELR